MSKEAEALARKEASAARLNQKMKVIEGALVRKAAVVTSAGMYGAMDQFGVPKAIKGFPWKLGVWALMTGVEAMTKGAVQQFAGGVGDTTLGLYVHGAVAGKTLIAGDGGEV